MAAGIRMAWACFLTLVLGAAEVDEKTLRGFRPGPDGDYVAAIAGAPAQFEASLAVAGESAPGWHCLTAEYRTVGLAPPDLVSAYVDGGAALKTPQTLPAASAWAPLRVYFQAAGAMVPRLRLASVKTAAAAGEIHLKNLQVTPGEPVPERELLANPAFALGTLGEVPCGWYWQYNGEPGDYALVEDRTFKSGTQALLIKNVSGNAHTLSSFAVPLPATGQLVFTVWAKSDSPAALLRMRLLGDNYNWKAEKDFPVTSEWRQYRLSHPCPAEATLPFGWARIDIPQASEVRFAAASLTWQAEAAPAGEPGAKVERGLFPPLPGRNLLPNSGFEFGLNNWMLDFFAPNSCRMSTAIANSPEFKLMPGAGIDGSTAFLLASPYAGLISGCLPLREGQRYTLSACVQPRRANASLRLFLIDPGWQIYNKEYRQLPPGVWTRVELSCVWEKRSKQKKVYARFDGDDMLLDHVQLELGELSDYQAPEFEAGFLATPDNVFVQGRTPPELALKVVDRRPQPGGLTAQLSARDAWGQELWTQSLPCPAAPAGLALPVHLPDRRLGVFDLEARFVAADGLVAGATATRFAVVLPPASRPAAGLPLFGVCYETCYLPNWMIVNEMPLLRTMGAGLGRLFLKNQVWESPDLPQDYLDSIRERAERQRQGGFDALIACYNNIPKDLNDRIRNATTVSDADLNRYAEYLRAIVVPLQKQIRYWEIANEPNLWRFYDGPRKGERNMPPAKYLQLLKAAHRTIKAIAPDLQVVGVCLNGADFAYLEELMDLGAAPYMDAFSYHSYRAAPEVPDTYRDLVAFRKILDTRGFRGQLINSEQYYAANKFIMHGSDEESSRYYYLPGDDELQACGNVVKNFIHHAAAGFPWTAYSPQLTLYRQGGFDRYYLFHAFAAYNAAAHFLSQAGPGHPVEAGSALRAFLFPQAAGGPLLTLNAVAPDAQGRLRASGLAAAFDMMGNAFTANEIAQGLPVTTVPLYLRFPPGTGAAEIVQALHSFDILGLGEAFKLDLALTDESTLVATVTNRLNKIADGQVVITAAPPGWTFTSSVQDFKGLEPGASRALAFSGRFVFADGANYPFAILAKSGADVFAKKEFTLSPLFVARLDGMAADGDLREWATAHWLKLGQDHLTGNLKKVQPNTGPADLAAEIALGWHPDYFALAVKVDDDSAAFPETPASAWPFDSLQVYFDQGHNAAAAPGRYDSDDLVYAISLANGVPLAYLEQACEGRYVGEANQATGLDKDVQVQIVRRGQETVYEVKIPRHCLPFAKLGVGAALGFALLVNDNDGKGRKQALTMTPAGTEPHRHPELYRDLYLK